MPNDKSSIYFIIDDELHATSKLSPSGGWQDWTNTYPVTVKLIERKQTIRLVFKGGNGFIFNLNWFDFKYIDD